MDDAALRKRIEECWDSTELEDLYLPYKPHRKTRADIAIERGLLPLAEEILKQRPMQLPKNEELTILIDVGYPDAAAKPLLNHDSRKPLSETVTYR